MHLLDMSQLQQLLEQLGLYAALKHENGSQGVAAVKAQAQRALQSSLRKMINLPIDPKLARRQPNDLAAIRALRPAGARRLQQSLAPADYKNRLEGALLGRLAGCTLGAPVEAWAIAKMQALAAENKMEFPPRRYWRYVPQPKYLRYKVSMLESYTGPKMCGVPVDDDVGYTLLGLLIAEEYGPDFSTEDVAKAWLKYLPLAYTAELVTLENLKRGIPARQAGARKNPYCEWIGADIRSDPWGYLAPGWPERAASMAYRDAYLSHRRQGIYGAMYFAAAIAAAFTLSDPLRALEIGLTEIPKDCSLAQAIRWALKQAPRIKDYQQARAAVDEKFKGMSSAHTINNACLTVWGITIGGTDITRVLGETVAMGLDNDCTAATAGSIVGAVIGKRRIPKHWYSKFNDTVCSYLIGQPRFSIKNLVQRFSRIAQKVQGMIEAE